MGRSGSGFECCHKSSALVPVIIRKHRSLSGRCSVCRLQRPDLPNKPFGTFRKWTLPTSTPSFSTGCARTSTGGRRGQTREGTAGGRSSERSLRKTL